MNLGVGTREVGELVCSLAPMDVVQCWPIHIVLLARAFFCIVPLQPQLEHPHNRSTKVCSAMCLRLYISPSRNLTTSQLPTPLTRSLLFFEAMSLPQTISELWEPTSLITITRDDMRDIRAEASRCWLAHHVQAVEEKTVISWDSKGWNSRALSFLIDTNPSCGRYCECRNKASVYAPSAP